MFHETYGDLGLRPVRQRQASLNRHQPAAFNMVNVDGKEAASVVEGVEQRKLLLSTAGYLADWPDILTTPI